MHWDKLDHASICESQASYVSVSELNMYQKVCDSYGSGRMGHRPGRMCVLSYGQNLCLYVVPLHYSVPILAIFSNPMLVFVWRLFLYAVSAA